MAVVALSSSGIGRTSLSSSSASDDAYRPSRQSHHQSAGHLRMIVCESSSTIMATVRGSEGNVLKQGAEISSFAADGNSSTMAEKKPKATFWWSWAKEAQGSSVLANSSLLNIAGTATDLHLQRQASPRLAPPASSPITATATTASASPPDEPIEINSSTSINEIRRRRSALQAGAFTAEKARALRKSMRASESWHDGWYHSAIAARLAEPVD